MKMERNSDKVAVLGAGTMGGGIAAHLANVGFEVYLYDISRSAAQAGLSRALEARPPHFYSPDLAERVVPLSTQDDLERLSEALWVCEAIVEKEEEKRNLYEKVIPYLSPTGFVSTNTSGLEIARLCAGMDENFRRRFMGTHFFNPPRYLKLVELIPGADTDPTVVKEMTLFLEDRVGRRVVRAKDTPGFIANRYGMWSLFHAIKTSERLGLSVEAVDEITGPFLGRPRTGTFRLADLIGLDIMEDIAWNIYHRCPHDSQRGVLEMSSSMRYLREQGKLGAKTGGGYYQREGQEYLVLDFKTRAYRARQVPDLPSLSELSGLPLVERIASALDRGDEVGEFLREYFIPTLRYALDIAQEIAHSVQDIDQVMKWGWGWEMGPFEWIDALSIERLEKGNKPIQTPAGNRLKNSAPFYRDGSPLNLETLHHDPPQQDERYHTLHHYPAAQQGKNWSVHPVSDGVCIFCWNTKLNVIDADIVQALRDEVLAKPEKRWILTNEGRGFSAGFNLQNLLEAGEAKRFDEVEKWLKSLQDVVMALKSVDSVSAVYGFALGGGMEVAMGCRGIVAHPETLLGLPEALVGLVPSGGGTSLMRLRSQEDLHQLNHVFRLLILGEKVPAHQGKETLFLQSTDRLLVNPDQLIFQALQMPTREVSLAEWKPAPPPLNGILAETIHSLRAKGDLGEYGAFVAEQIKHILVRPATLEQALETEREAFLKLLGHPLTQARIKHMLETGKPLKN